jgi:hypothetical protein
MINKILHWLRRNRVQDEVSELQRQLTVLSAEPPVAKHDRDSGDEPLYRALCENFESAYLALFKIRGQSEIRRRAAVSNHKSMTHKA